LKDEKDKVKEILIKMLKDAWGGNRLFFKDLKKEKDFDEMNAEFQLEKFSKIQLKDQYKNLVFEEVTEKEEKNFRIWETAKNHENRYIHYVKSLVSCINNEGI